LRTKAVASLTRNCGAGCFSFRARRGESSFLGATTVTDAMRLCMDILFVASEHFRCSTLHMDKKLLPVSCAAALLIACAGDSSQPPGRASQRVETTVTPEAFRTAAACADCRVGTVVPLDLPLTRKVAFSAKVTSPTTAGVVTILDDGSITDERNLIAAEKAARLARFGRFSPELFERISIDYDDEPLPVVIAVRLNYEFARKESLLADTTLAAAEVLRSTDALRTASAPIEAALTRYGIPFRRSAQSRLIYADVPRGILRALDSASHDLPIDLIESQPVPRRLSTVWHGVVRAPDAQILATGAGNACLYEDSRPLSMTNMVLANQWNGSTTAPDSHSQMTAGIIRNTVGTHMAPSAILSLDFALPSERGPRLIA